MGTFNYEVGMYILHCSVCDIAFAIPIDFRKNRQKDHKTFYCPNDHAQYYPYETEEERLREQLDCCQIDSRTLDYRARYYKGQLTKLQKQKEE